MRAQNIAPTPFHSTTWRCWTAPGAGQKASKDSENRPPHGQGRPRLRRAHPVWTRLRPPDRPPGTLAPREQNTLRAPTVCQKASVPRAPSPGAQIYCAHTAPLHDMEMLEGQLGRGRKRQKTAEIGLHPAWGGHSYNLLTQYGADHARPDGAPARLPTDGRKRSVRAQCARKRPCCGGVPFASPKYCAHTTPLHQMEMLDGTRGGAKSVGKQPKITSILAWAATTATCSPSMEQIAPGRTAPHQSRPAGQKRSVCPQCVRRRPCCARHPSRRPILRPHRPTPRFRRDSAGAGAGQRVSKDSENRPPHGQGRPRLRRAHPVWTRLRPPDRPPGTVAPRGRKVLRMPTVRRKTSVLRRAPAYAVKNIAPTPFHSIRREYSRGTRGGAKSTEKRSQIASTRSGSATATTSSPSMEQITPGRTAPHQSRPAGQKALRMPTVRRKAAVLRAGALPAPKYIAPTPFHSTTWRCSRGCWGGAKSAGKQPQTASPRPNSATTTTDPLNMEQITPGPQRGQIAPGRPDSCPESRARSLSPPRGRARSRLGEVRRPRLPRLRSVAGPRRWSAQSVGLPGGRHRSGPR